MHGVDEAPLTQKQSQPNSPTMPGGSETCPLLTHPPTPVFTPPPRTCALAVMSARFSLRVKLRPKAGCVDMKVVRPMDFPMLASEAISRKCWGARGVRYSRLRLAAYKSEVFHRKRCGESRKTEVGSD